MQITIWSCYVSKKHIAAKFSTNQHLVLRKEYMVNDEAIARVVPSKIYVLNEVVDIVNAGILSPNIHSMPNSQVLVNQHVSGISKLNQMQNTHIHTNHTDVQIVKTNRPIGA